MVGGLFGVSMLGMAVDVPRRQPAAAKKAEVDAKRREYLRYLAQARRQVRRAADQQRAALLWRHPPPATLWSVPAAGRMWERRPADADFGVVRVATGPQKLATPIVPPQTRPLEDLEPMTAVALRRFLDAHSAVPDLPVALALRGFGRVVLRGRPARTCAALARAMLAQLVTSTPPTSCWSRSCAGPERAAEWDWVKWLPHAQHDRRTDAVGPVRLVADTMAALEDIARRACSPARPRFAAGRRR